MPILSAGRNPRIPGLQLSSTESAPVCLIRFRRSRWLTAWWLGLHGLLGLAALLAAPGPLAVAAALTAVAWHGLGRRPRGTPLLLLAPGPRFALPLEERFDLRPTAGCREGPFWLELVFDDGGRSVLVLADQLQRADWRRLRLALAEPG